VIAVLGAGALTGAAGIAVAGAGDTDRSATLACRIDPAKPKNVILLVGDGMGDAEVTLGRSRTSRGRTPGRTYMEIARDRGKAAGNVSTAEITDATPADPSSHISQRGCQGPPDTRTTCPAEAKTASDPRLGVDRRAAGRRGLRPKGVGPPVRVAKRPAPRRKSIDKYRFNR
jgi:alkaline phosphatase